MKKFLKPNIKKILFFIVLISFSFLSASFNFVEPNFSRYLGGIEGIKPISSFFQGLILIVLIICFIVWTIWCWIFSLLLTPFGIKPCAGDIDEMGSTESKMFGFFFFIFLSFFFYLLSCLIAYLWEKLSPQLRKFIFKK